MKRNILLLCFVIISLSLFVGCSQEVLSMDENIDMGDWTYAIDNSLDSKGVKGLDSNYVPLLDYIVISLKISNIGKKNIEIDRSQFELIDGNGNEYIPTESKESTKININPKLNTSIKLSFKVPKDIEPEIKISYGKSNKQLLIGEW
ncbi:DUF4352 domain-containing protein [Chengkuizengella axinellae]|uniref:DUF4352 domain-containing protein n=1 Tax=Chengkuizengella axinellae TaxID=3064388 RepID=A0ABT9IWD2_9BACL|nr:DUF4352 domain-containing protein [Chengkuizengella sp. 2205SS18-9]MDP5273670.1 DUF4352 domain-containing protein [Chengkuizengella sp. 2205SS18-9]